MPLLLPDRPSLDYQLTQPERIAAAMRSNGNSDVTVRIFPGVSHSLLPDAVGLSSGWAALPGFLTSPDLLDFMSKWAADKLGIIPKSQ